MLFLAAFMNLYTLLLLLATLARFSVTYSVDFEINLKKPWCNEHYPRILKDFFGGDLAF